MNEIQPNVVQVKRVKPILEFPPIPMASNGNQQDNGLVANSKNPFNDPTSAFEKLKLEPISRTPNYNFTNNSSNTSPFGTPPARRSGGNYARSKCLCDIKDNFEPHKGNTSPITLKRYEHQQSQLKKSADIICKKCNNVRKASSANATTSMSSNGICSPLIRRGPRSLETNPFEGELNTESRHYSEASLNMNSCDTSTISTNNSSITNIRRFWANGASPRLNGNRHEITIQQSTYNHTRNPLSPPPPHYPRRNSSQNTRLMSPRIRSPESNGVMHNGTATNSSFNYRGNPFTEYMHNN